MRKSLLVSLSGIVAMGALHAQEVQRFSFGAGAGFVEPVRNTGTYLDLGWNVQAGGGINFSNYLGAMLNFNYSSLGITSSTLANLGAPGGTVSVMSFTLDPVIHLHQKGPVDVYLTGGGGIYWRQDQLTQPALGFSPFIGPYGYFNVPTYGNQVLASYSVWRPGYDAGVGISFGTRWHAKFYAEARYNKMFTGGGDTDFVPVTFGVRW